MSTLFLRVFSQRPQRIKVSRTRRRRRCCYYGSFVFLRERRTRAARFTSFWRGKALVQRVAAGCLVLCDSCTLRCRCSSVWSRPRSTSPCVKSAARFTQTRTCVVTARDTVQRIFALAEPLERTRASRSQIASARLCTASVCACQVSAERAAPTGSQ